MHLSVQHSLSPEVSFVFLVLGFKAFRVEILLLWASSLDFGVLLPESSEAPEHAGKSLPAS